MQATKGSQKTVLFLNAWIQILMKVEAEKQVETGTNN
jgi:hypothetical protein